MKKIGLLIFALSISQIKAQNLINRIYDQPQPTLPYTLGYCTPLEKASDSGYVFLFRNGNPLIDGSQLLNSRIIKTDSLFNPIWRKDLTGESKNKVFTFSDGSCLIWTTGSYPWNFDLEKIDNTGKTIWHKRLIRPSLDVTMSAALLSNSKIRFVGSTGRITAQFNSYANAAIIDIDTSGNILRSDSLQVSPSTTQWPSLTEIVSDSTGNDYILGYGANSDFIIKMLPSGSIAWSKIATLGTYLDLKTACVLSNGDLLVGGEFNNSVNVFLVLMRINPAGNLIWAKQLNEFGFWGGIKKLNSGNILLSFNHRLTKNDTTKNVIMEIDSNANIIWAKRYVEALSISQAYLKSDTEYCFMRYVSSISSPVVFNINNLGVSSCQYIDHTFSFTNASVTLTPNTCTLSPFILSSSSVNSNSPQPQSYIDSCNWLITSVFESENTDRLHFYPNPLTSSSTLQFPTQLKNAEVIIYDILGKEMIRKKMNGDRMEIERGSLESGVYFVRVRSEEREWVEKIVVE